MIAKDIHDYKGFFPANPTPVNQGEGIKEEALRSILEYDIANGAGGFWLAGTTCLLYTSPSPRDGLLSRMPSSA